MKIRFLQKNKCWCKILSIITVCLIGQAFSFSITTSTVDAQEDSGSDNGANLAEIDVIDYAGSAVTAVIVQGNYAYLGIGAELVVIDVSDPLAPRRVASMILSDQIRDILASSQDLLYVIMESDDHHLYVEVVDVSKPEQPKHKSQLIVEYANNIKYGRATIHPNAPYIYVRGEYILIVIDFSQPQTPSYTIVAIEADSTPYSLSYLNGYLFSVDRAVMGYGVIRVWDLSQPENPRPVFFKWYDNLGAFFRAFIANNFAFAYIGDGKRTNVFDLSNLSEPKHIATWNFGTSMIVDNYAYTDQKIWDISDPTNPVDMGAYSFSPGGSATTADDYRYLIMGNKLQIVTFAERTSPRLLGSYALQLVNPVEFQVVSEDIIYPGLPFSSTGGGSVISGDYLFQVHQECNKGGCSPVTVTVYDVSSPRQSWMGTIVSTLSLPDGVPLPSLVSLQQGYLILLSIGYAHPFQVHLIDVSNPMDIHLHGVYTNGSVFFYDSTVAISDEHVFIHIAEHEDSGTWVIDFTDPSAPQRAAVIDIEGLMAVVQGHLVVLTWDPQSDRTELKVYNVSDPTDPILLYSFSMYGYTRGLASMNSWLYVLTNQGLLIFDASIPAKLEQVASYPLFHVPSESLLILNKNKIFIDQLWHRKTDLHTLWFSPPVRESIVPESSESLTVPDGPSYTFPTNAFSEPVTVTHQARYPGNITNIEALTPSKYLFEIKANTETSEMIQLQAPYSLSMSYAAEQILTIMPETLSVYFWDGESWQREESSEVDLHTQIITAQPERLGLWTVMGESRHIYFPNVQNGK